MYLKSFFERQKSFSFLMDNSIDFFLLEYKSRFPFNTRSSIKEIMSSVDKDQRIILQSLNYNDPNMIFILSFMFGFLGIDRFLIGDNILGILKLITLGGFGLWFVIDWFLIIDRTKTQNYQTLLNAANLFN